MARRKDHAPKQAWYTVHNMTDAQKALQGDPTSFVNEILGDYYRWKATGILSLIIQEYPEEVHQPTPLRVIDLDILLK